MKKEINFDMDGTLADFYGVANWLGYLLNNDTTPYEVARPLFNFSALARQIHRLQRNGYEVNIISWLSKNGTEEFNTAVTAAKLGWLKRHLPSVEFDNISIVEYGTPKSQFGHGILFDDEEQNREEWGHGAFDAVDILDMLREL